MPNKQNHITELSVQTNQALTAAQENWAAFLRTMAWNYKYSFAEQVLIYAQRPKATACAPIETWNQKFHRWVNRGAKGIALIDDRRKKLALRYVFDVSDTNCRSGEAVYLWTMKSRYEEAVTEALENAFGALENKATFADVIISTANNLTDDNLTDYATQLARLRTDSFLEELDELNIEVSLKRALRTSISYTIMLRCGLDAQKSFEPEDFAPILNFNTIPTISLLGNAVSDISEMALREISSTVRSLYLEERRAEKFALSQNSVQNRIINDNNERGTDNGNDLHDEGGLPSAGSDTSGTAEHREVRHAEEIISSAAPEGGVHEPAPDWEIAGAFSGDRSDGTGERDLDDRADDDDHGCERGIKSVRSDEMDGNDEQPETNGGGSSPSGPNLHLITEQQDAPEGDEPSGLFLPLPSIAEQIDAIDQSIAQTSLLSVPQQIIDEVLSTGGNEKNSTLRICAKYMRDKSADDIIAFLQREYKRGGKGLVIDGQWVSAWWDRKNGMHIAFGDMAIAGEVGIFLSWRQIESRIHELLDLGRYMPQSDILSVPSNECRELAARLWFVYRDDLGGIPDEWCSEKGGYPEDVKKIETLLSEPGTLDDVIAHLEKTIRTVDAEQPQRRSYHDVQQVLSDVCDLHREPRQLTSQVALAAERTYFITQDEVDDELCRGGQIERGKFRIYSYFTKTSDSKKRAEFLKHEYGTGGRSDGVYDTWNEAKGLSIRKAIAE